MNAIILISSIFYVIGLKIGTKIELTSKSSPVEKIISNKIATKKSDKTFEFKCGEKILTESDSLKNNPLDKSISVKNK
ncbi:MAG: hypothetical protein ACOCVA_04540 [Prolixibacteraceae bacterium]